MIEFGIVFTVLRDELVLSKSHRVIVKRKKKQ